MALRGRPASASYRTQRSGSEFGTNGEFDLHLGHRGDNIDSPQKEMNMAELPFPWSIYAEHQSKAARCGRISDKSWGIENGLTNFLTAVDSSSIPANPDEFRRSVDRAVATGSWVERNRARLRRKYLRQDPEPHAEPQMLARARLAEIRSNVSAAEWELLIAQAAGLAAHEIAAAPGATPGSIRTRIARLRVRLRPAAYPIPRPVGGLA
jgi:hypothetical protein